MDCPHSVQRSGHHAASEPCSSSSPCPCPPMSLAPQHGPCDPCAWPLPTSGDHRCVHCKVTSFLAAPTDGAAALSAGFAPLPHRPRSSLYGASLGVADQCFRHAGSLAGMEKGTQPQGSSCSVVQAHMAMAWPTGPREKLGDVLASPPPCHLHGVLRQHPVAGGVGGVPRGVGPEASAGDSRGAHVPPWHCARNTGRGTVTPGRLG